MAQSRFFHLLYIHVEEVRSGIAEETGIPREKPPAFWQASQNTFSDLRICPSGIQTYEVGRTVFNNLALVWLQSH